MHTPNEIVWWARDNICPLCRTSLKQDAEDILTEPTYWSNDWKPYVSFISCHSDVPSFPGEVDHYGVVLEYSDPKKLSIIKEELFFEHRDMKFEITISNGETTIMYQSIENPFDWNNGWRQCSFDEPVFDFGPGYTKEKFLETLDMLMILQ